MGFVPSAGLEFIPRIVAAVTRQLPGVSFSSTEMMSYEIVEALRSGRLDLGLTRMPGRGDEIVCHRAVSEPFMLAAPKDHPLATQETVTVADLDQAPFVAYSAERGGYLREVHTGLFAAVGIAPRTVQEVSQTHTILALVNRGIGVALVPASSSALKMDNLAYRRIDLPAQFRSDLYLALGPKRRTSPLHRRVTDLILEELRDEAQTL